MDVSVIIPALNEAKGIAGCINSFKRQSLKPLEIIVADGGSRDETRAIARRLGCRVVVERKRTIAAGRQKGAEAAKGEVLAFTDADAFLPKDWLKELVEPFKDEKTACVFGSLRLQGGGALDGFASGLLGVGFWLSALIGRPSGAGSCMAVSACAFRKAGGFDKRLVTAEDIDLEKRLQRFGRVVYAPAAVAFVSARRIRKWGYPRFIAFHLNNWFRAHFLGRSSKAYERVR